MRPFPPRLPPGVASPCSAASQVSGRRRRPLKGSPPSATQTERAVFPHSAFMNGFPKSGEKGSVRQGLPCPPESGPSASDLRTSNDRIVSSKRDVRVFHKGNFPSSRSFLIYLDRSKLDPFTNVLPGPLSIRRRRSRELLPRPCPCCGSRMIIIEISRAAASRSTGPAAGGNQDRRVMMPSPSIYTYRNARHSCWLSAGTAQARIAALHSIAVARPILSRYPQIARSHRRMGPWSAATRLRRPLIQRLQA